MNCRGCRQEFLWSAVGAGLLTAAVTASPAFGQTRGCQIEGRLLDASGNVLGDGEVTLLTSSSVPLARTRSSETGVFGVDAVLPGVYLLEARTAVFAPTRQLVRVDVCPTTSVHVRLSPPGHSEMITVTAVPADARGTSTLADLTTVTDDHKLAVQADSLVPRMLVGEMGVSVQQTSTSQASPFVRGLSGQQVVGLIDGMRFNTATFRPGANQYLAFIDGDAVDRIDVVRGPGAVAYGSDAMGGTVNVLTRATGWGRSEFGVDVRARAEFASADRARGGALVASGGRRGWGFFADVAARSHDDLRTGKALDSRSVATRLLGLPSSVLGDRLAQTGFEQRSGNVKVDTRTGSGHSLLVQYMRSRQDDARRYDQLDGGAGNLLHRFDPQGLDFGIARYDRATWGPLDTLSVRGSYNRQIDDRTYQNINNNRLGLLSAISSEHNVTRALGAQVLLTRSRESRHRVSGGLEVYDELVSSTRVDQSFDSATQAYTTLANARGRYPDGASFTSAGAFAQYTWNVLDQLSVSGSARYSRYRYEQGNTTGKDAPAWPLIPYESTLGDWTYQASAVWQASEAVAFTAQVSRGFRAPNINDRGTIGLSGNGFETSPEDGVRLQGQYVPFGATSAAGARSVTPLEPETLVNTEAGVRVRWKAISASAAAFNADLSNLIERNVIVLPYTAVGATIGGETIIRQDAIGSVYTALSSSPVFVRTNARPIQMRGAEASASVRLMPQVSIDGNVSYVRGKEKDSGRPPGLENGIPPLQGSVRLRWVPPNARWWAEASVLYAAAQTRLSANDIAQARIGGFRTSSEITNFFNNGAVSRGLVRDGVLLSTGETVQQVITRVLGPAAATGAPLYTQNDGFAVFSAAWNMRIGRHLNTTVALDNVTDTNYRVMGSGIDGTGFNFRVLQTVRF